jgi:hypothetical protein
VERLEDRTVPAIFNPLAATADGAVGSLRADIIAANNNGDLSNTFNLQGAIYNLTLKNTAGQENLSATGDLDLVDLSGSAATKIYIFVGAAAGGTIINASQIDDRVFQIIGSAVTAHFQDLTITGGAAVDNGTAGAMPGQTDALGGGILNQGGAVSFTNAVVFGNSAQGFNGGKGANGAGSMGGVGNAGGAGVNGGNAAGGGLYSSSGTITLVSTLFTKNSAHGGNGGNGGVGASGTSTGGQGGAGGGGGSGQGGGIWTDGNLTADTSSSVSNNTALAGNGGDGGAGGVGGPATGVAGIGGAGGTGGAGRSAQGGGIFAGAGTVTIDLHSEVGHNKTSAGNGGKGAAGGNGRLNGGMGAAAGAGGFAEGGGIFAGGANVTIDHRSSVNNNTAIAVNAFGGSGGAGGNGAVGLGGTGNSGGQGGSAQGGGIFAASGSVTLDHSGEVNSNLASAGPAGIGGGGGTGQLTGGAGAAGGNGGSAGGGGIWSNAGSVLVDISSSISKNSVHGGNGAAGGKGGVGSTGAGGAAGAGGDGGAALGGGIGAEHALTVNDSSGVRSNNAMGGAGGVGGQGGQGFTRSGGMGGAGGNGGTVQGVGIYLQSGTLSLDRASINQNSADEGAAHGGAGGAGGPGATAGGGGGHGGAGGSIQGVGIYTGVGVTSVTILNSTIGKNQSVNAGAGASGGMGGAGVVSAGAPGAGGNGGNVQGSGIHLAAGTARIINSTVSTNTATQGGTGGAAVGTGAAGVHGVSRGGGTFIEAAATVVFRNVTIAFDQSGNEGGGIRNEGSLSQFNTLIGDNASVNTNVMDLSNVGSFGTTPLNNLIRSPNGHTIVNGNNGNIVGVDPLLGPLALHGGPTLTHLLLKGSPAIDAGASAQALDQNGMPLVFDQRGPGFPRIEGARVDIGATEFASALSAAGADLGSEPWVNVYDAVTGQLRLHFLAYESSFRGGVRVAVADINGDGVPDIITAPGGVQLHVNSDLSAFTDTSLGRAPEVKVFSGADGSLLDDFLAYNPSFKAGLFVAVGNIDGHPDIITGPDLSAPDSQGVHISPAPLGDPDVRVFFNSHLINTGAVLAPDREFLAYAAGVESGVRVAVGDLNGDGVPDIVTVPGPLSGADVRIFDGKMLLNNSQAVKVGEFAAYDPTKFFGGLNVALGDVNADGTPDIVTGVNGYGGPEVKVFDGKAAGLGSPTPAAIDDFMAFDPTTFNAGVRVAAVDVNGDGHAEVLAASGPGGLRIGGFPLDPDVERGGLSEIQVFDVATGQPVILSGFQDSLSPFTFPGDSHYAGGVFVGAARKT